jgi:2-oxoglutarate dehydrogenase complex dehydrogenase (E1) component-like enzyme
MYQKIAQRGTVPDLYREHLLTTEFLNAEQKIEDEVANFRQRLDDSLEQVNKKTYTIFPRNTYLKGQWAHMNTPSETNISQWATGCEQEFLKFVGIKSVSFPEKFVSLLK